MCPVGRCFQISALWRAFSNSSAFSGQKRRIRVDGTSNRKNISAFLNSFGVVWTGPKSLLVIYYIKFLPDIPWRSRQSRMSCIFHQRLFWDYQTSTTNISHADRSSSCLQSSIYFELVYSSFSLCLESLHVSRNSSFLSRQFCCHCRFSLAECCDRS